MARTRPSLRCWITNRREFTGVNIPIAVVYIRVAVDLIFEGVLDCTKTVIEAKVAPAFLTVWIYVHVLLTSYIPIGGTLYIVMR